MLNGSEVSKQFEANEDNWTIIYIYHHFSFLLGIQFDESGPMYQKTGRQVEKLTEILFFVIVKIMPQCLVLLKCITRYFVYFTSGFNNDAFELPFPMW